MKAPSPIAVIRSILGPEQADALLRGGVAPESLARTVLEATAPTDLAAILTAAGLEKAEPLSARTVLAVQNLVRLNQMRADRAVREAALGKTEKKPTKQDDRRRQFWQGTPPLAGKDRYGRTKDEKKTPKTQEAKKAERAPKLPPDQHGIGPKHEPEEKIAPTKQLEPQVHQNHGAKRRSIVLKSDAAEWRSRPILRAEDTQDLDHAAAARSLSSGSAQEGERQAYEEYSRQQRLDAMAHHFRQAGEAQKRGDRPTSDRHMLAYTGHARALGIDPAGHPPPEVGERIRQLAGKRAAFRGHPADRLA